MILKLGHMTDPEYTADITRLRKSIEDQMGWGIPGSWHSKMFSELSDKIYDKTQVLLSDTTLKRFFGVVNHQGLPSITTLDTLSKFNGYKNWRDFRTPVTRKKSQQHPSSKSLYVTVGFVLSFIIIMLLSYREKEVIVPEGMTFQSRVLTDTYPNSVVFDLDLHQPMSDCLHIQQYWDPTKTIRLTADQEQATGIYYFPGYFRAKLLMEGKVVDEHDLFLKSRGWLGILSYSPVPKYFKPESRQNMLHVNEELYGEVSKTESPLNTEYHYINDLGDVSADNFSVSATVRNTFNDRWAVCETVQMYIIGTTGAYIIPYSQIGCSSDLYLMLNDKGFDGKSHDLSALGTSFNESRNIGIRVKDKEVTILIEDQPVMTESYEESMGRLVGIRFKFLGVGEVDSLSILDQNEDTVALPL